MLTCVGMCEYDHISYIDRPEYYAKIQEKAIFSIWTSLQVLQKARIKIVAHAIHTYHFFFF